MGHQTGQVAGRTSQVGKRTPEVDYVEAEHDPVASRRASDAAIRQMLGPRARRQAASGDEPSIDIGGVQQGVASTGSTLSANAEERAQEQIELLRGHAELIASRMRNYKAAIERREVDVLRSSLDAERALLMESVGQLPPGSPLIERAKAASERAQEVMQQLTDFANANDAHKAVERDFGSSDTEDHYKNAREQNDGYCDRAPQETPPCNLSTSEREKRRADVRAAVHQLSSNWRQAITSKYLEEMFKKKQISFEEQLGRILFDVLFSLVSGGVKALVAKGIEKEVTSRIVLLGEGQVAWPTAEDIASSKRGADKILGDASAKGKEMLAGSITAQQLQAKAKAAASVRIPADRAAFLSSLEDVPAAWEATINQHLLKDLFDDDLVMLADVLPQKAREMLPSRFKQQIETQLRRFEEQVLAVNTASGSDTRPVQVITGQGPVRWALVRPETKPDNALRGEWKGSPTRTGKWRFVRWIDEDMRDMAVERAIQGPFGHGDPTAGAWMRTSTDTSFWSDDSLKQLASSTNASRHDASQGS